MESAESLGNRLAAELLVFDDEHAGAFLGGAIGARDAAVALRVLHELQSLIQTNKWLDLMGRKEAAWGRAYQEASKQLLDMYAKAGGVG